MALRLLVLFCFAFVLASSGQGSEPEYRWRFEEKLTEGKYSETWVDPGIFGKNKRAEVTVGPVYKSLTEQPIVGDGKSYALRYLLAPRKDAGADTPLSLWMWGFDRWGGKSAADHLEIRWRARYSKGFNFAGDTQVVELFYDLRTTEGFRPGHDYDGPRFSLAVRDGKELIVMAYVREEKLRTGLPISKEWKVELPKALEPEKDYAFTLDLQLNTPPTPKQANAVKEEEVTKNGRIVITLNGKEIHNADKLLLRANERAWTSFVFGGRTESKESRNTKQWIDYSGIAIGEPK